MKAAILARLGRILAAVAVIGGALCPAQSLRDVYVFAATHSDVTFTGPPPFSVSRHHRIYDALLERASKRDDYRFLIESGYMLDQYLMARPEKAQQLTDLIRSGRIDIAAQWSSMLQNMPTSEDIVRNILVTDTFARTNFGLTPQVQSLSDVPGQHAQTPQVLRRSGLNGLIITRAGPKETHLFEWQGTDGSVLPTVTMPLGYPGGYLLGMDESIEAMEGKTKAVFELSDISSEIFTNRIEQVAGFEAGMLFASPGKSDRALIEVSWDNMMPPTRLWDNIKAWNDAHGDTLRVHPVQPRKFFEQLWPENTPRKSGAIPSVWFNGGGAVIGPYQSIIRSSHALLRAEKWSSLAEILLKRPYPVKQLEQAWKNNLITLDHEGSALETERNLAGLIAKREEEQAQLAIASHVPIPNEMGIAIVVFNAMNWTRSGTLTPQVYLVGDPFAFYTAPYHKLDLVDSSGRPAPFEILESNSTIVRSIRLRFRAESIPPLGWKTYYLRPAAADQATPIKAPVEIEDEQTSIESESLRVTFSRSSGKLHFISKTSGSEASLRYYHQVQSLSSKPGFFRLQDTDETIPVQWSRITREDNLIGQALTLSGAVGDLKFRVDIQLDGAAPVRIAETMEWSGHERMKLVRETELPEGGSFTYGAPFAIQRLEDVMEGSGPPEEGSSDELPKPVWYQSREFDGWFAWRLNDRSVTVASESRGGVFDGRHVKETLFFTDGSPANGDTTQGSTEILKTSLTLSFDDAPATSARRGWEFYNPLETMVSVANMASGAPAVYSGAADASTGPILTTLKKAEDGAGFIARSYALDKPTPWPALLKAGDWSISNANLMERPVEGETSPSLQPFEIRTVRLQRK